MGLPKTPTGGFVKTAAVLKYASIRLKDVSSLKGSVEGRGGVGD